MPRAAHLTLFGHCHALRLAHLQCRLGRHPNIISLRDVSVNIDDDEIYFIMKLLDSDLHRCVAQQQQQRR